MLEVIINGTADEFAALVRGLTARRDVTVETIFGETKNPDSPMSRLLATATDGTERK